MQIKALKNSSDFKRILDNATKFVSKSFVVFSLEDPELSDGIKVGVIASKKSIGIAVDRNRAKRRLRAVSKEILSEKSNANTEYVLVARKAILDQKYELLKKELEKALTKLEANAK